MTLPSPRTAALVAALLALALGLRVWQVQHTSSYQPRNDAGIYLTLASDVAHSGDYRVSQVTGGAGGTRGPTAYFPPAFPYLLAGVDLLDGHTTRRGAVIEPARLTQAALGTVIVALVGLVATEAFGGLVGLVALGLAAVYPVLIDLSGTIVAENLMTVFVLLAVWAGLRVRRARHPLAWTAACGVFCGLATLTHQNAVVIVIPLVFAVWFSRPRLRLRSLAAPVLLLAVTALTIAPWTIRNAIVMHQLIPVSDENGITLAGTYNAASAAYQPVPYKWRLYVFVPQDRSLARHSHQMTEYQLGSRLTTDALDYIRAHPTSPLVVAYHNTLRLLELEGSTAWVDSYSAIDLPRSTARVGVVSFWVLAILAALGLVTALVRRGPKWIWAVALLLALTVVLVNVETPRFREPVDPFLVILAACAFASAVNRLRGAPVRSDLEVTPATGRAQPVKMA